MRAWILSICGGLTISDSIFVTRWLLNSIKASHRGGSITNLWCAPHVTCGRSTTSCSSVGSCWSISCTSDIWTLLCLNIKIQHFAQLLAVTLTWVLLQGDTCLVCLCMHAFWLLKTQKRVKASVYSGFTLLFNIQKTNIYQIAPNLPGQCWFSVAILGVELQEFK